MKKRILMVDDEIEYILPHIEALQDEETYEVLRLSNVDAAIDLLQRERFDLLILDMLMPPSQEMLTKSEADGIDLRETGLWLYRYIREQMALQDVPIIFMSVVRDEAIRGRIKELERRYGKGEPRFLTKPILPSDLLYEVGRVLHD